MELHQMPDQWFRHPRWSRTLALAAVSVKRKLDYLGTIEVE